MDGNMVKLIRHWLKLNQPDFAKLIGVTETTIADIESGHRKVTDNVIAKISHKVDVMDESFQAFVKRNQELKRMIRGRE